MLVRKEREKKGDRNGGKDYTLLLPKVDGKREGRKTLVREEERREKYGREVRYAQESTWFREVRYAQHCMF
jgi:hypothetical protein